MRFSRPSFAEPTAEEKNKKEIRKKLWLKIKKPVNIFGLIIILILVILSFGYFKNKFGSDNNLYNAVFLSNGQVYFGQIYSKNSEEMILKNVFYFQSNTTSNVASSTKPQVQLVKLGSEIHGPTDEITFNMSQVVFYENLRDDSKVVAEIKNYK